MTMAPTLYGYVRHSAICISPNGKYLDSFAKGGSINEISWNTRTYKVIGIGYIRIEILLHIIWIIQQMP